MAAFEQQLSEDIDHDGQGDKGQRPHGRQCVDRLGRAMLAEAIEKTGEETHGEGWDWGVEVEGGERKESLAGAK